MVSLWRVHCPSHELVEWNSILTSSTPATGTFFRKRMLGLSLCPRSMKKVGWVGSLLSFCEALGTFGVNRFLLFLVLVPFGVHRTRICKLFCRGILCIVNSNSVFAEKITICIWVGELRRTDPTFTTSQYQKHRIPCLPPKRTSYTLKTQQGVTEISARIKENPSTMFRHPFRCTEIMQPHPRKAKKISERDRFIPFPCRIHPIDVSLGLQVAI